MRSYRKPRDEKKAQENPNIWRSQSQSLPHPRKCPSSSYFSTDVLGSLPDISQLDVRLSEAPHFVDFLPTRKWGHGRVVVLSTSRCEGEIIEAINTSYSMY